MGKRWRYVTAKSGELKVGWGAVQWCKPDLTYAWGGEGATRADSHLLMHYISQRKYDLDIEAMSYKLGPSLIQELEARGYDITTLKFSIQKKKNHIVPGPCL